MTLKNEKHSSLSAIEEWHRTFKVWWDSDYNARPLAGVGFGILLTLGLQWLLRRMVKILRKK